MQKKIRIGIIFGGKSVEHEVSIQSARNIYNALDKDKYEPVLIGIDQLGNWHLSSHAPFLEAQGNLSYALPAQKSSTMALIPSTDKEHAIELKAQEAPFALDVVFPIIHGTNGEDGTVQGLLKLLDIPFVGPSVLGSAVCMDKDVMKRLLRDAGIPIADFLVFYKEKPRPSFEEVAEKLFLPFFVKPANGGSSVGITKVKAKEDFDKALEIAFNCDRKVLCEQFIEGREIEFCLLGNDEIHVSLPGEVVPFGEFNTYEAKYVDNAADFKIPADVDDISTFSMQEMAKKAFSILCCEGMARADFFLQENGAIYLNELNTLPGFTKLSMYPRLWEASGVAYSVLIDTLIHLAFERYQREKGLITHFTSASQTKTDEDPLTLAT